MAKTSEQSIDVTKQIEHLFQMGAHLGHRKSRVHPKAYRYIYKFMNGVSIIDLTKTVKSLNRVRDELKKQAAEGKKLLVVATKKNHAATIAELASGLNIPYTTTKWLPGLLTNFDMLIKNVQKLEKMKGQQEDGTWEQFVKHERMEMSKQLYRLERFYKGLIGLKKRPDLILVIDSKKEKNAIVEAKKNKLPIFGIVDTNSNPEEINLPIVMNDDSPELVKHILEDLLNAYAGAYNEKKPEPEQTGEGQPAPAEEPKKEAKDKAPAKKTASN